MKMDHLTDTGSPSAEKVTPASVDAVAISEREMQALNALAGCYSEDFGCLGFKAIARRSGLDPKHVRRSVRALARKGLAEYVRGLWTEDGEPAGAGYRCTKMGYDSASKPIEDDYCY